MTGICVALIAMAIGAPSVWAAKKNAAPQTQLTETGQKLEAQYAEQFEALKADISKALPTVEEQKKAAYLKTREAEKAAEAHANATQAALNENRGGVGLLNHRKAWIGRATTGVAEAKEKLKQAEAMTGDKQEKAKAVKEAQEALAKIQENYDWAARELKISQEAVDKAKLEEPKLIQELEAAQEALAQAQARTMQAIHGLNLESFLSSDKLDARLAKYVVLFEAAPRGLAEFAQQGNEQEALVERLLADADLMLQMAVADSAKEGKYGRAMEIYTAIQAASTKAEDGVLQRMACLLRTFHSARLRDSHHGASPTRSCRLGALDARWLAGLPWRRLGCWLGNGAQQGSRFPGDYAGAE